MIKRSFKTLTFLATLASIVSTLAINASHLQMLYMGSIQFPRALEEIPDVRVYHCGHKIKCETNNTNKQASFAISGDRQRIYFDIIITPKISYKLHEFNTVKYLIIPQGQAYKWYRMFLVKKIILDDSSENRASSSPVYGWDIHSQFFGPGDRRIPDDAVIICYNPDFVAELKGGNAIELPSIVIKSNVVDLAGSEDILHEKSVELLLSSLDYNALHSTVRQEQQHGQKTVLAMNI